MRERFARYIAVITLSLTISLAACSSRAEKAAAAAERFSEHFRVAEYWQAKMAIIEALSTRDDVADYWLKLAQVSTKMGDYGGAYSAYVHVIELDPTNIESLENVSDLAIGFGQLSDAEKYTDQLLEVDPQNLRARLSKGYLAIRRKHYPEASRWADQILVNYPLDDAPLVLKAKALFEMDQRKDAVDLLEKAIPLRGATRGKLDTLLEFYTKQGDLDGIERTYGRYLELAPDSSALKLRYATALYQAGKAGDAERILVNMLSAGQQQDDVATVMIDYGGKSPSVALLEQLGANAPPATRAAIARVALAKGQPDLAMRLVAPYVGGEMNPNAVAAASLFAAAKKAAGLPDEALAVAERVLAFEPANPRALRVRAEVSLDRGNFNQALTDARVLVRDHPKDVPNQTLLAEVYERKGEVRLADSTLRSAYNDMPGSEPLLESYIAFMKRQKRAAAGAELARDFTRQNPASAQGWKMLADLCRTIGDSACVDHSVAERSRLEMGRDEPKQPA